VYWGLSLVGAGVFNHLAIVGQAAWRKQLNLASELGDLAHGLGSPPTVTLISVASKQYHNFDELEITDFLTTVRIWLGWDPGASTMLLRYF
jgi:hypothetical protein